MTNRSIEDYNTHLSEKHGYLHIIDYFSKMHHTFFPEVDISFMNYFLDLSTPDKLNDFCIYEKDLRKYGILNDQFKAKDIVRQFHLTKEVDWKYQESSEEERHTFFNFGVYIHNDTKRRIVFTPKAFKKLVFGSFNITFIEYYMLLEMIFRYYHDYQMQYMEKKKMEQKEKMDEIQALQATIQQYKMQIEECEDRYKRLVSNVNITMDSVKQEINSMLNICEKNS